MTRHKPTGSYTQATSVAHKWEKGITKTSPGNMLATGKSLMLQMRNPVATISKPPAQEKSAIMDGEIIGSRKTASIASASWIINYGIAMVITA